MDYLNQENKNINVMVAWVEKWETRVWLMDNALFSVHMWSQFTVQFLNVKTER